MRIEMLIKAENFTVRQTITDSLIRMPVFFLVGRLPRFLMDDHRNPPELVEESGSDGDAKESDASLKYDSEAAH